MSFKLCSSHALCEGGVSLHFGTTCHAVRVYPAACSLNICLNGGRMLLKGLYAEHMASKWTCPDGMFLTDYSLLSAAL